MIGLMLVLLTLVVAAVVGVLVVKKVRFSIMCI
jgi:hypothetical protein